MVEIISFSKRVIDSFNKGRIDEYLDSLNTFIDKGQEEFLYTVEIFGEKEKSIYTVDSIIKNVKSYILFTCITSFKEGEKYSQLLIGYYHDTLFQILNLKKEKFAPAVLSTDLSLSLLFALTYFPQESNLVGKQLIRFLEYHKQREEEKKHYKGRMKEMFGYSDVVWLSSIVSKYYGNEKLSIVISEYCNNIINPTYQKAVNNLFSKDQSVVNEWVDELVQFHIQNSKSDLTLPFNHEEWQYFPIEIISLLEIRLKEGLKIDFVDNNFIKEFLPHIGIALPVKLDDFTLKLKKRILGNGTN